MTAERNVQQCRYAEATLFLAAPMWLDAWQFPWSCRSTGTLKPISDTRSCTECDRWVPRERATSCCCRGGQA